jgi:DNA-binding transcriptional regulator LsrR (DeoR family)
MLKAYERVTIANLAESDGVTTDKKKYRKSRRFLAQKVIRRLLIEKSMTNRAISEHLGIPIRTVERYVADLYEHDNVLLAHAYDTQTILTQANICLERLLQQRNEVLEGIANNASAPFKDRVAAHNFAAELAAAAHRFFLDIKYNTTVSISISL